MRFCIFDIVKKSQNIIDIKNQREELLSWTGYKQKNPSRSLGFLNVVLSGFESQRRTDATAHRLTHRFSVKMIYC